MRSIPCDFQELRGLAAMVRHSETRMKRKKDCWGEHLKPLALPSLPGSPLISVLVANYNYGRFLGQALESVLKQTYQKFEIVVCDDGSTDESRDILTVYGQKYGRIKVLLQDNEGQSEAILAAFHASCGEVICFLDSDDIFLPTKLEELVEALVFAPDAGFAVHRLIATDGSLRMMRPIPAVSKLASGWMAPQMSMSSPQMHWGMPPTSGLALHRAVAERILPHLRGRRVFADSVIQVLAPLITPIIAIDRPLGLYRVHGENSFGPRKFTAADVERLALQDAEVWCAWRSFVMRIAPDLPACFPIPPEKPPSVLNYACARMRGEPIAKTLYGDVVAGPRFAPMHWAYRWFWRSSAFFPDWLFEKSFNVVYGKGSAKLVISRLVHWLRSHGAVLWKAPAETHEKQMATPIHRQADRVAFSAPSFSLLGIRVDAVQIPGVIARIEQWIARRDHCRYIAVTGMHGVMEAQHDPAFKVVLNSADLVVPDGMPLVWIGRLRGLRLPRRVYGPELMLSVCRRTASRGVRHFFFGGAPGIPEKLAETLRSRFSGLDVVGTCSLEEEKGIVEVINTAAPDILWVGLSTPKQEKWMYAQRDQLRVPVLVGVGAAFDIHSAMKQQAPVWMQEHGLEWIFRLFQEPQRLWRRYILYGSEFIFYVTLELLGLRKSD
jgi:N-acetylglucosaminyldiphosphoundecaprenol N-acetyl-beta-D-mannosaminyltransferase